MLKCALMQTSKSRVRAMCFLHSVYRLPQKREKGLIVFFNYRPSIAVIRVHQTNLEQRKGVEALHLIAL